MILNESSKDRAFFTPPNGKKHWNLMPMGAMNAHSFFVAMVSKMEIKWNALYGKRTKKRKEIDWELLTTKQDGRSTLHDQGKARSRRTSERKRDQARR